jgi:hypothetical protein
MQELHVKFARATERARARAKLKTKKSQELQAGVYTQCKSFSKNPGLKRRKAACPISYIILCISYI